MPFHSALDTSIKFGKSNSVHTTRNSPKTHNGLQPIASIFVPPNLNEVDIDYNEVDIDYILPKSISQLSSNDSTFCPYTTEISSSLPNNVGTFSPYITEISSRTDSRESNGASPPPTSSRPETPTNSVINSQI